MQSFLFEFGVDLGHPFETIPPQVVISIGGFFDLKLSASFDIFAIALLLDTIFVFLVVFALNVLQQMSDWLISVLIALLEHQVLEGVLVILESSLVKVIHV